MFEMFCLNEIGKIKGKTDTSFQSLQIFHPQGIGDIYIMCLFVFQPDGRRIYNGTKIPTQSCHVACQWLVNHHTPCNSIGRWLFSIFIIFFHHFWSYGCYKVVDIKLNWSHKIFSLWIFSCRFLKTYTYITKQTRFS